MLTGLVVSIVKTCTRFALATVLVAILLAVGSAFYTARNFDINTDINKLISPDLDWRQRDNAFEKAFDQERLILAVVEAPTAEFAGAAGAMVAAKLATDNANFEAVQQLGGGPFFERNGLLFLPTTEVKQVTGQFGEAAPLVSVRDALQTLRVTLAIDESARTRQPVSTIAS